MDRFDRQLLNLMQHDSSRTAEQLSEQVALSPSAIQRRVRRMKEEGVIICEAAIVDPRKVGAPTFFVVSIHVERERPEMLARLRAWLLAERAIQQAFYVTGEADFVLIVTAADTHAFDTFMVRLVAENANVRRFTTNVALGLVKRGLVVPVEVDAD